MNAVTHKMDTTVFEAHPYHNRQSLGAIICGLSLTGIMSAVIGIYSANSELGFMTADLGSFDMAVLIMTAFVLACGIYALIRKATMEGISMILFGIWAVVYSASALLGASSDLALMDFLIGAGLSLIAAAFLARRDIALFAATGILGVGLMAGALFGDLSDIISGIANTASGILYVIYAFSAWYSVCSDRAAYPWQDDDTAHAALDAVSTAGFMIMGILSILVGIHYLNVKLDIMDMGFEAYNIAKILMSGIILYYAAVALRGGAYTSGMMSIFFGTSTFTFSASALLQNTGGAEVLDILVGLGMLMACIVSLKERQISSAVTGILVFSAFSIYPFLPDDIIYYSVGIPILIVGLLMSYNSGRYIYDLEIRPYRNASD